eukprot:312775-Prorocentrum_minimum.AAC.2
MTAKLEHMKKLERHHTIFLRGTTEEHLLEVRVAASNSSQPVFTGAKWLTVSSYQQHGVYEPKERYRPPKKPRARLKCTPTYPRVNVLRGGAQAQLHYDQSTKMKRCHRVWKVDEGASQEPEADESPMDDVKEEHEEEEVALRNNAVYSSHPVSPEGAVVQGGEPSHPYPSRQIGEYLGE